MEEDYSMSERILRTLENIILSDRELIDFIILPSDDNSKNKTPVLYQQHHLGLEQWCVKHVYRHVCSDLFKVRTLLANKKLSYPIMNDLNYLLIGALLINPDVTTFWNMKRELVECDILEVEKELFFSKLVLTRKGKSNDALAYRRWLLKRIIDKMVKNNMVPPLSLLENELNIINMASEVAQNNYHSWNHRIWCMENIATLYTNFTDILLRELEYSERWISNHVSEHTGYHYREYLTNLVKEHRNINSLLGNFYDFVIKHLDVINDGEPIQLLIFLLGKQNRNLVEESYKYVNYITLLLYELFFVIDKLNTHLPEHESLFLHRRFIIYNLLESCHEYHGLGFVNKRISDNITGSNIVNSRNTCVNLGSENGEKQAKLFKCQPNRVETSNLCKMLSDAEKKFIASNSSVTCSPVQVELTKRHEKWLKFVVGCDLLGNG